jgi:hypothetical protein
MKAFALALVVAAALATVGAIPALAVTSRTLGSDNVAPCQNGKPPPPGERCRGPVDNESGGGGTALTIAVSVVVGLGVATLAFVVLRRQLASQQPAGASTSTSGTPTTSTGDRP